MTNVRWGKLPAWKREVVVELQRAVYHATLSLTDEEVDAAVKDAVCRARKDLSS